MDRRSGFKFQAVRKYLKEDWGILVANNFSRRVQEIIELISDQREIGAVVESYIGSSIRKMLISKHNYLYYKFTGNQLNIINFKDNRQNS